MLLLTIIIVGYFICIQNKKILLYIGTTGLQGHFILSITGKNEFHVGINLGTDGKQLPIVSVAGGTVYSVKVEVNIKASYGLYVKIKHDDGMYSLYAHTNKCYVKVGDKISVGQTIALSGGGKDDEFRGSSTGRHLHFDLRNGPSNKERVDPLPYLI